MNKNELYLTKYRELETAVRNQGFMSIKDYEEQLTDITEQSKLRICRVIRNFLEHEDSTFIDISEAMITFIENKSSELDLNNEPVKKIMIAIRYGIKNNDPIMTAANFMARRKLEAIPVFDAKDFAVGIISYLDIVKFVGSGDFTKAKKVDVILRNPKFGFINGDETVGNAKKLMSNYPDKVFLVLNQDKKIIGWIK